MSNSSRNKTIDKKNLEKNDPELTTSTPRWVKIFSGVAIVLILLVIIMMVFGNGNHGPGRHMKSENASQTVSKVYKVQQI